MSARERVRRLLESAMMNARAVISAMKTGSSERQPFECTVRRSRWIRNVLSQALQNNTGARGEQFARTSTAQH